MLPKSLCIPRGHWLDYLEYDFELDIRDLDQWLRAPRPEAFATTLEENSDLWCEIIQLLGPNPPF
jgi:hypothetical protein